MSNQIQLQLASPKKLFCDRPFTMVTVPGGEGAYGVKAGHAPMATGLGAGLVEAYDGEQSVADRWFVIGGFCEVLAGRCTVMADEVLSLDTLDRAAIEAEIAEIKGSKAHSEEAEARLKIAEAKLKALHVN